MTAQRSLGVLAVAAVFGALLVAGPARPAEADHCNGIVLHSGVLLLLDAGLVGCHAPDGHVDTDFINPGSTSLHVRVVGARKPAPTSTLEFSGLLDNRWCTDGVCRLEVWTEENESVSHPGENWDSGYFPITRNSSIMGGEAVVTICFDDELGQECRSRTYRTIL